MNITAFSHIGMAYVNPNLGAGIEGYNAWFHSFDFLFADMRFMSMFSILFGAGMMLFIQNIELLLDKLNIPKSLGEISVPEDCSERIAKKAMQDQAYATNPKKASLSQMKEIVTQSIKQAR